MCVDLVLQLEVGIVDAENVVIATTVRGSARGRCEGEYRGGHWTGNFLTQKSTVIKVELYFIPCQLSSTM